MVKGLCDYDADRVVSIACRFSSPVIPGETIRTEMWRDGAVASFRSRIVGRDAIAVNNGRAELK
ncbi:MaoC like domain protein [compost metagenome]